MDSLNMFHILLRNMQRLHGPEERKFLIKALPGLKKKIKDRKVPNGPWYQTIRDGKRVVCYVAGTGVSPRTILAADMVPYGKEI